MKRKKLTGILTALCVALMLPGTAAYAAEEGVTGTVVEEPEALEGAESDEAEAPEGVELDEPAAQEFVEDALEVSEEVDNSDFVVENGVLRAYTGDSTEVVIPEGVTSIGSGAFASSSTYITSVIIPEGVTSIGNLAFNFCSSLTSITIPESVTRIGSGAFYSCTSLTSITIPNRVTLIDYGTFYNCTSLTSITIPESVTSIGSGAFFGCTSLTSVTIPESVTSIENPFGGCTALETIEVSEGNPRYTAYDGILYNKDMTELICCPGGIQKTVVEIPKSVTSIEGSAFWRCKSLTNITIPESVTSIGGSAFFGCSSLTSITIPNSVTSIGDEAFGQCTALETIEVSEGNTSYTAYDGILYNKEMTELICCPGGIQKTVVEIPKSVTSIGDSAFYDCSSLTNITIPESVTSIGSRAFFGCSSLTSITIPSSVKSIGTVAFNDSALAIIYGEEDSYAQEYAKENGFLFSADDPAQETAQRTVIVPEDKTGISSDAMQVLVNINNTQNMDIVISAPQGLSFTFVKGSMQMVNEMTLYDFGAEIVTDYSTLTTPPFAETEFVSFIHYNHSGNLPGTAYISIPVDSKWIGMKVYYYEVKDGTYTYLMSTDVDESGMVTVSQNHCSDYVLTIVKLSDVNEGFDSGEEQPDTGSEEADTNSGQNAAVISPETGETVSAALYVMIFCVLAGILMLSVRLFAIRKK